MYKLIQKKKIKIFTVSNTTKSPLSNDDMDNTAQNIPQLDAELIS